SWTASVGPASGARGHAPPTPPWPTAARHATRAASPTPSRSSLVPVQWSAGSSSHTPLCELPMQRVVADWKASAGHVPDVPVHVSATSHWPAEARHVTVAAWYSSTQVLFVPEQ